MELIISGEESTRKGFRTCLNRLCLLSQVYGALVVLVSSCIKCLDLDWKSGIGNFLFHPGVYQQSFCLDLFRSCFAADKCAADFMALFCQQKCRQNIKLVKLYMLLGTSCRLDLQYLCLPQTRLSLIKLL